jgi:hypothetical protein
MYQVPGHLHLEFQHPSFLTHWTCQPGDNAASGALVFLCRDGMKDMKDIPFYALYA